MTSPVHPGQQMQTSHLSHNYHGKGLDIFVHLFVQQIKAIRKIRRLFVLLSVYIISIEGPKRGNAIEIKIFINIRMISYIMRRSYQHLYISEVAYNEQI